MVSITIFPAPLPEELKFLTDPRLPIVREFNQYRPKKHFFTELLACDSDWIIDLSQATETQGNYWWHAHILAKCLQAFSANKIVLLAGAPLKKDSHIEDILNYMRTFAVLPDILDETPELLSLGNGDILVSDFLPECEDVACDDSVD